MLRSAIDIINIKYSELVFVALIILHAKHICCILFAICGLPTLWNFPTFSQKRAIFGKIFMQHNIVVLILYPNFVFSISRFKRIQWEIITNIHTVLWKLPIIVRFYWNVNFLTRFQEIQKSSKMKFSENPSHITHSLQPFFKSKISTI